MHKSEHQYKVVSVSEDHEEKKSQEVPKKYGYGVRHNQLIIVLLCMIVSYIARAHLGVTVVAMTHVEEAAIDKIDILSDNNTYKADNHNITQIDTGTPSGDERQNVTDETNNWKVKRSYKWSKPVQEMVFGSFFLGYCIMMLPMGMVSQRWGGKLPFQISMLVNGVVSFTTPWLAMWGGWKAVCACRILQGLSQAGTMPAVQTLLAKWVSSTEIATLSSYVYMGSTIGTVLSFQMSGLLSDSAWGWPSTFWVIGLLCIIVFIILTFFGAASPLEHSTITDEEKNFILGHVEDVKIRSRPPTPWRPILTSKHIWACFITHIGSGLAFVFMLMQVPTYIHFILGVNVKSSGILSSLPYVASFFTSIAFGLSSDYFTNKKIMSVKNTRRTFNTVSQVGVSLALLGACYTQTTVVTVSCLVAAMGFQAGIHTGWMVNYIDLAPNYCGTMMAIGNTLLNMFILLLPVLVSNIVIDVTNQYQWRIIFTLVAGLAFSTNIIFAIFMSADVQEWDSPDFQKKKKIYSDSK